MQNKNYKMKTTQFIQLLSAFVLITIASINLVLTIIAFVNNYELIKQVQYWSVTVFCGWGGVICLIDYADLKKLKP